MEKKEKKKNNNRERDDRGSDYDEGHDDATASLATPRRAAPAVLRPFVENSLRFFSPFFSTRKSGGDNRG